jgi:hypothetical protein
MKLVAATLILPAVIVLGIAALEMGVLYPPPSNKPTQGVVWRGNTFVNRAEFARWLRARGISYRVWARRHPALTGFELRNRSAQRSTRRKTKAGGTRDNGSSWVVEGVGGGAALLTVLGLGIMLVRRRQRLGSGWPRVSLSLPGTGRGRAPLHVQRAQWASERRKKTLHPRWADGEALEVEEEPNPDDETLALRIIAVIRRDPGAGWAAIEKATPGVGRSKRKAIRDGLLASGEIVNVAKGERGQKIALAYCVERKAVHLYAADDPSIFHLLPASGADGNQIGPATPRLPTRLRRRLPPPVAEAVEESAWEVATLAGVLPLLVYVGLLLIRA